MKWHVLQNHPKKIDPDLPFVAIVNGGFIRNNELYEVGETLTVYDFKEEMPFPRNPVVFEMTGEAFKYALEEMLVKLPANTGAFPQFSDGFQGQYDPSAPAFSRVSNVYMEGKPLEPDAMYTILIQ